MKKPLAQQITLGLGIALVLLIANAIVSLYNIRRLIENERSVSHSHQVIAELEVTLSTLKDAETGQRGYLITGDDKYLQPYRSAISNITKNINSLKKLTTDNPNQQRKISTLEQAIATKLAELENTIKLRREQGFTAAEQVVRTDVGRQIMDNIRALVASMENEENRLLQQRAKESQASTQQTLLTFLFANAVNLALLALVYYLFRRNHLQSEQEKEKLLQYNQRLALAMDAGKMGSWDWNIATNESFWTPYHEIIFGYEPGNPHRSYKEWAERVHPEDLPQVEAIVLAAMNNVQDFHAEYRIVLPDQSLRWVTAFGRFQCDEQGRPIQMTGMINDITERKQAEAEIRKLNETLENRVVERTQQLQFVNEELEAFAYSVSHDLRAPLRAMQGFAEALLEDYGDNFDELGKEYAQRIVTSAVRLEDLIQDLLTYSRLSRTELSLKRISLTSVVSEAMNQIQALEQQAEVTIQSPLPDAIAHRLTLIQIITNLLSNAIKFVEADVKPQVRVWAEIRGEWVRLWVSDNGIGIAPEHQKRIFRVFERLHGQESYPGTGIGLAIVRKGIERMGGQVGVESQLGQGSRFWIELKS
ncbi:sensor histidine kinase [Iningainema tapete]|uniref:histidine kinase n=1 Tax=Iningainema tapete BLCC-T55 TaxID=2748662 RepID=A0A8J6XSN3_9CYAN|nr:sensor histidine kinase [Iningainema tapete]MBD2777619.1 CHASE3 domain-containing protein [Iningainema tapete BLCC-T55]